MNIAINRRKLFQKLLEMDSDFPGGKWSQHGGNGIRPMQTVFTECKLPATYNKHFMNVRLYNYRDELITVADVVIYPSGGHKQKPGFHRVFVWCPWCGVRVPFGRYHQHCRVHPEVKHGVA